MSTTARIWNSTLTRKTPLRNKTPLRQSAPLKPKEAPSRMSRSKGLGKGKKTKQWDKDRAKLKVSFQRAGITRCERMGERCTGDNFLGFAHSKKRRNITTEAEQMEVILACNNCHDEMEALGETIMGGIVRGVIAARPVPVK